MGQCKALTKDGRRCSFKAKEGDIYCGVHSSSGRSPYKKSEHHHHHKEEEEDDEDEEDQEGGDGVIQFDMHYTFHPTGDDLDMNQMVKTNTSETLYTLLMKIRRFTDRFKLTMDLFTC
jgi:hypothetical protein